MTKTTRAQQQGEPEWERHVLELEVLTLEGPDDIPPELMDNYAISQIGPKVDLLNAREPRVPIRAQEIEEEHGEEFVTAEGEEPAPFIPLSSEWHDVRQILVSEKSQSYFPVHIIREAGSGPSERGRRYWFIPYGSRLLKDLGVEKREEDEA